MSEITDDPLAYYARPGIMTDPQGHADLFDGLPTEIPALCRVIQNNLIHIFWAERYGVQLPDEQKQQQVNIRSVAEKLACIRSSSHLALTVTRLPERRLVGNCRDFSTLLCAILRHQRVPARARCGFATYFAPQHYEDHWVCEYWNANERRWVMVDAQLDAFQREALGITFDPYDVPPDQFLPGGKAWQLCRAGQADPDSFGISEMHGLWFVRGDLMRDLASLNKVELLPWDGWGLVEKRDDDLAPDDMALLDRIAELTLADNRAFTLMRLLYQGDARLRVPPVIRSYGVSGVQSVELPAEPST